MTYLYMKFTEALGDRCPAELKTLIITGMFKRHGMFRSEVFALTSSETLEDFTSIANAISANSDEEVWMSFHISAL
jgi:hypothetical protein